MKTRHLFRFALIIFCLCQAMTAHAMQLRQQFHDAETGDYLVAALNKNYTLLHIFEKTGDRIILEEITVPVKAMPNIPWQQWLSDRAPNHTSWVMYEVDLVSGRMLQHYSFTENGWMDVSRGDNFFTTLLGLYLHKTPQEDRKKVGPRPNAGSIDRRPIWNPILTLNGQKHPEIPFTAWRAAWPHDGTDLAGKKIDLYLPSTKGPYLTYFPYWIEIQGAGSKAKLRIIDSGRQLSSPRSGIPQRKKAA